MGISKIKNFDSNLKVIAKKRSNVTQSSNQNNVKSYYNNTGNNQLDRSNAQLYLRHLDNPNDESLKGVTFGAYSDDVYKALMDNFRLFDMTEKEAKNSMFLERFVSISDTEAQLKALEFYKNYDFLQSSSEAQAKFGLDYYQIFNKMYNNPDLNYDNVSVRLASVKVPDNPKNNIIKLISTLPESSSDWKFLKKFLDIDDSNMQELAIKFYNNRDSLNKSSSEQKKFGEVEYLLLNEIYEHENYEYKEEKRYMGLDFYSIYVKDKDLEIGLQKDFNKSKSSYDLKTGLVSLDKFMNTIYFSPDVRAVNFTSEKSASDASWSKTQGRTFTTAAETVTPGNIINVFKYSSNSSVLGDLAHEVGHINDRFSGSDEHLEAIKKDSSYPSSYARESVGLGRYQEDQAESYRLLVTDINKLKSYKNRYALFQKYYPEFFE